MYIKNIVFFCLLLVLTYACRTIKTERPVESYNNNRNYEHKFSEIFVPITINIGKIEKIVNDNISGLIYVDDNYVDGDDMKMKVWKMGDIAIRLLKREDEKRRIDETNNNNNVTSIPFYICGIGYDVPVHFWISKRFQTNVLGINMSNYNEIEGGMLLNFETYIYIDRNYNIITDTRVIDYKWIDKPVLKTKLFDMNGLLLGKKVLYVRGSDATIIS